MNRIISLFLFIFVANCLTAQYNSPIKNKVTLGVQTTADGLIWRGVASIDTVSATSKITRVNKQDTSVFILLDTVTNLLWHYKTASNGWLQAGGSTFDTTSIKYVNTYGDQTVNGAKTFTSALTATRFNPTANTVTGTGMFAPTSTSLGFSTAGTNRMSITNTGNIVLPLFELNNTNAIQINQSLNAKMHIGTAFGASFVQNNNFYNGSEYVFDDPSVGSANMVFSTNVNFQTGAPGVSPTTKMIVANNGNVGIGEGTPTAVLHLKAGTATASTAPLKFTSGTNLTTPELGAMEFSLFNGANRLFLTPESGVRKEIGYADLSNVSGTLAVANGGTGATTLSPNNYLIRTNSSGIFDTANIYEANGNVGINVIPSSWGSAFKAIESGDNNNQSAVAFNTGANGLNFFANAFFDGSNSKYKYNGFASRFVTADGKYEYYSAPSGTAGDNITFTEVMTINSSGNLGINQPVPTEKLHVVGNGLFTGNVTANPISGSSDVFKFKTTGNTGNGVLYSYSDGTGVANGIGSNLSVSSGGSLTRPNTALGAWAIDMDNRTNPSIQFYYINPSGTFSIPFKIDSFSNVGIGTGTITEKLHVVGNGLFTGNVGIGSATPTTSGSGITFPATQSASTSANTLDDYEEGTWTPVYQGLGGSIGSTAYSRQQGRYTKIGRFCHASGEITLTNKGSWSSGVVITGLPFATTATEQAFGFIILGFVDLDAGVKYCQFRGTGGANNNAYIDTILDNAERVILFTTAINNNSTFEFSFIYTVN